VPRPLHFPFDFDVLFRPAALPFGINASTTGVAVTSTQLVARFGPWRLATALANIKGAEITGPYQMWKVMGGARLSLLDSGITFATNARRGLCIEFHDPVPAALPVPLLRHAAATVTVAEPERLLAVLRDRSGF
jgi:hypothetical protein